MNEELRYVVATPNVAGPVEAVNVRESIEHFDVDVITGSVPTVTVVDGEVVIHSH